eukprot:gene6650-6875_t
MESKETDLDSRTEFAKRNPVLAKIVPNHMENAVDMLLPNSLEAVLDKAASKTSSELQLNIKYHELRTNIEEGLGEVAGVLFQVAKYACEKFHIGDLVFGVYQLYLHHSTVNSLDAVDGNPVTDLALVDFLIQAATAAAAAYCPTRDSLCAAAGISNEDLLLFVPETTPTRPAYAVWQDEEHHRLIWGFRGTTDLNVSSKQPWSAIPVDKRLLQVKRFRVEDMLTDACAACSPYCGGAAHWGMLSAAQWFVENEVAQVKELLDQRPGYELLLVGHSLGAGTAAMLAHMLKNDAKAADIIGDVRFKAVGIATPAVLTEELAGSCREYITSVVLMHDIVPRFSIHNVFKMKEEMDATDWGEILKMTVQDWMVPDIIENTATYQRLARKADTKRWVRRPPPVNLLHVPLHIQAQELKHHAHKGVAQLSAMGGSAAESMARFFRRRHEKDLEGNGNVNNTAQQNSSSNGAGAGVTAAAVAKTGNGSLEAAAKAALKDPSVVEQAVDGVTDKLKDVNMNDVHEVFAPGRLFFIKRLDKFKGRARYGDDFHSGYMQGLTYAFKQLSSHQHHGQ